VGISVTTGDNEIFHWGYNVAPNHVAYAIETPSARFKVDVFPGNTLLSRPDQPTVRHQIAAVDPGKEDKAGTCRIQASVQQRPASSWPQADGHAHFLVESGRDNNAGRYTDGLVVAI
jgi:hypothetical protein